MTQSSQIKGLFCIGPFNTGTNLLNNILNNSNCVDRINKQSITILEADKIIDEETNPILKEISLKHVFSKPILNKYVSNKNTGIVILYKNIYNWIYSIKKSPYHLVFETLFTTIDFRGNKFDNIIELYNHYYKMYIDVIKNNNNVIFVDYYKLINDNISFNYINYKLSKFGLCITNKLQAEFYLGS